jgi:MerR family copper efflux transcriptional regulator
MGELSRRTGLSIKEIREYEGLGLIYSVGRSDSGYRLFDSSADRRRVPGASGRTGQPA